MKAFADFLPIILFFVAYKMTDNMQFATAVIIIATVIQVAIHWLRFRKFENTQLITLVAVIFFGGATLIFKDERFIKMKPSAVYIAIAIAFAVSHFVGDKKTIIQRMLGDNFTLPAPMWTRLSISWIIFFLAMSVVNIAVAAAFSTDVWVNFKLFGALGLTIIFTLIQGFFIMKYQKTVEPKP